MSEKQLQKAVDFLLVADVEAGQRGIFFADADRKTAARFCEGEGALVCFIVADVQNAPKPAPFSFPFDGIPLVGRALGQDVDDLFSANQFGAGERANRAEDGGARRGFIVSLAVVERQGKAFVLQDDPRNGFQFVLEQARPFRDSFRYRPRGTPRLDTVIADEFGQRNAGKTTADVGAAAAGDDDAGTAGSEIGKKAASAGLDFRGVRLRDKRDQSAVEIESQERAVGSKAGEECAIVRRKYGLH